MAYPIKDTAYYRQVADRVVLGKDWAEATERDHALRGRHSRAYYKHADQWLRSEVAAWRLEADDAEESARKRGAAEQARLAMLAADSETEA